MANSHNKCSFEGRIARDPKMSTVQVGNDMVSKAFITLAVDRNLNANDRQRAKNGDKSVVTADFVPLSAMGAKADFIQKYCPKGKAVIVDVDYIIFYQILFVNTYFE